MRYVCANECKISPFGNCVVTKSEMSQSIYNPVCPAGMKPCWTEFDHMGKDERDTEMSANFHWFVENYDLLHEQYGTGYYVIVEQHFKGCFPDFRQAYHYALSLDVPIFNIQYNNGEVSGYTVTVTSPFITVI